MLYESPPLSRLDKLIKTLNIISLNNQLRQQLHFLFGTAEEESHGVIFSTTFIKHFASLFVEF